jgi:hypothetical protein
MDLKAVVQAWVDALNRTDLETIASLYAENALNVRVDEIPMKGKKAIKEMFAREFAEANKKCSVGNISENGEWAMLEWQDPWGLSSCYIFHIINGKIHYQRDYGDKLSYLIKHGFPLPTEWCTKR